MQEYGILKTKPNSNNEVLNTTGNAKHKENPKSKRADDTTTQRKYFKYLDSSPSSPTHI